MRLTTKNFVVKQPSMTTTTGTLLIHCKDQKGIVARVAGFIHDFGGNILDSDHHTDMESGDFLMRTVFELEGFQIPREEIAPSFMPIAKLFGISFQLYFSHNRTRVGLLVSQHDHCLVDLSRAHQLVENGHRHDAYDMVANYSEDRKRQNELVATLKKTLVLWLQYRDGIARACGLQPKTLS